MKDDSEEVKEERKRNLRKEVKKVYNSLH